jgi:hypothetical protein
MVLPLSMYIKQQQARASSRKWQLFCYRVVVRGSMETAQQDLAAVAARELSTVAAAVNQLHDIECC